MMNEIVAAQCCQILQQVISRSAAHLYLLGEVQVFFFWVQQSLLLNHLCPWYQVFASVRPLLVWHWRQLNLEQEKNKVTMYSYQDRNGILA